VIGVGLGVLGLSPHALWRMTIKELEAALRARFGPALGTPPARGEFEAMMQRFPDA
jgi:uncharacterized phage protein (TIGR02216 family)